LNVPRTCSTVRPRTVIASGVLSSRRWTASSAHCLDIQPAQQVAVQRAGPSHGSRISQTRPTRLGHLAAGRDINVNRQIIVFGKPDHELEGFRTDSAKLSGDHQASDASVDDGHGEPRRGDMDAGPTLPDEKRDDPH
jgi:hypothetical protein